VDFGHRVGGAVFNSRFPSHDWMGRDSGVKVLPIPVLGKGGHRPDMPITPYLDNFDVDPETKRVVDVALRMTRVSLGLEDNFADGLIAKRIVELAKAGECNPDQLCQGAIEQLRGHLYGD
jgi:hypothetical protein